MMENPIYTISPGAIANGINNLLDEKEELQKRIDKAIEYIETTKDMILLSYPPKEAFDKDKLLDILKGEEK